MLEELIQGILIGLTAAIPVGPIALLIMRRSITEGRLSGIVSGLGAATADLICGTVTALGLTAIVQAVEHHAILIRLIGGAFLVGMGLHTIRSKTPLDAKRPIHERNLFVAYATTGLLTIANPLTFSGIMLVGAAYGVGSTHLPAWRIAMIGVGVFLGSTLWWVLLSSSAGWLGRKLGEKTLHIINLIAGSAILLFGIVQIVQLSWIYFHRS